MRLRTNILCSVALLAIGAILPLRSQQAAKQPQTPLPQQIRLVKPGYYVVTGTGTGGNTGVRITPDGLILVDTKNPGEQFYQPLMEQIRTVSKLAVRYVVVTHVHADHSGNIQQFLDAGAKVIGQQNLKVELAAQGKPTPDVTYDRDYSIHLGGVQVDVHYYGPGHTGGDSIVHFPDLKVVQTGDMIVDITPNVEFSQGGTVFGYQKALEGILKLDFDALVPGHSGCCTAGFTEVPGKVLMTRAEAQAFKSHFDTLVTRARDLVRKGVPKDQLLGQLKLDDIGWTVNIPQWTPAARLDPFYAELLSAK